MGLVMFVITAVLMVILTELLSMLTMFKLPTTTTETLGRTVGGFTGRVSNLFARKAPVAA